LRDQPHFRISAQWHSGIADTIAGFQMRDIVSDGFDCSSTFEAEHGWQSWG
jgi:hypothetical protein